jgi:hypothetical protein
MVLREEPGKQKTRSCRTQELARSSAQKNEWQKKGGLLNCEDRRFMGCALGQLKRNTKRSAVARHRPGFDDGARFEGLLRFAAVTSGWPTARN